MHDLHMQDTLLRMVRKKTLVLSVVNETLL